MPGEADLHDLSSRDDKLSLHQTPVLLTFVYYLMPLTGIDLPPFWGVVVVRPADPQLLVLGCAAPE
jgi:hypothetical protein